MDGKSLRGNVKGKKWGEFWLNNLTEFFIKAGREDLTSLGK